MTAASTHSGLDAKRTDIQVLRGIAVLAVVLYHARVVPLAGGYLGVDIFFVISGFLITGHIMQEIDRGRFSFASFYVRRARRLLPAAFCTLILTTLLASQVLTQQRWKDFVAQLLGALTFSANFVLPAQSGYFEASAETKPLLHTWSLSVEEQYYLLAPLLLVALRPRWRVAALGAIAAASLMLCVAAVSTSVSYWRVPWLYSQRFAFFMLPARAWEMLAGSLLAALAQRGMPMAPPRWVKWPAMALLCLVCYAPLDDAHPRGDALIAVLLTALLMAGDGRWIGNSAPVRAMARVGDWSYSIYLVHWPLFALAAGAYLGRVPVGVRLGLLGLSIALAALQYRFVEQPFRLRRGPGPQIVWRFGTGAATVAALALAIGWARYPLAQDTTGEQHGAHRGLGPLCGNAGALNNLPACSTGPGPAVALWGDSYAMHLVPGLRQLAPVRFSLAQVTKPACAPVRGLTSIDPEHDALWAQDCLVFNERAFELIASMASIRYVIMSSPFQGYLDAGQLKFMRSGRQETVDRNAAIEELTATLKGLIARGKTPILVSPPPRPGFDVGTCREQQRSGLLVLGRANCDFTRAEYMAHQRAVLDGLLEVSRRAGVEVVWLDKPLCAANGVCRTALDDGTSVYKDDGHHTYRLRVLNGCCRERIWNKSLPRDSAASQPSMVSPGPPTATIRPAAMTGGTRHDGDPVANAHAAAPLISVVIPVYKVEPFLRQCLDSVLAQTHSHLEILLVDDGSPDGCPSICEDYARRDPRVRVIHQRNQGLSAARNTGLDAATGEYVAFVDSDDWAEPDMLEALLRGLLQHGADVAGCAPIPEVEDGIAVQFPRLASGATALRLDREEALAELLRDRRLRNFSWSYLYRAALFRGVRFPAGKRFEDVHTTYRLFMQAGSIVALPIAKYHYRIRAGSITQAGDLGLLVDQYDAIRARQETLGRCYPRFVQDLMAQRFTLVPQVWEAAARSDPEVLARYRASLEEMARFTAANRDRIVAAKGYGRAGKVLVWLCSHSRPWAYRFSAWFQALLSAAYRCGD